VLIIVSKGLNPWRSIFVRKLLPQHALLILALVAERRLQRRPRRSSVPPENEAAMTKMMAAMEIQATGEVDRIRSR